MIEYNSRETMRKYDTLGEGEWKRFKMRGAIGELDYLVNLHFLKKYAPSDGIALDAGSGPCRFSIELAKLGLEVTALDISNSQLEIGRNKIQTMSVRRKINLIQGSIEDLKMFDSNTFDFVICIGGALSHMLERHVIAMQELVRVLKRGHYIVVSVMSRNCHIDDFPSALFAEKRGQLRAKLSRLLQMQKEKAGYHEPIGYFRKFSSRTLAVLLKECNLKIAELAAADRYPSYLFFPLENHRKSPEDWEALVDYEMQACSLPWKVNSGNMIIGVGRKMN